MTVFYSHGSNGHHCNGVPAIKTAMTQQLCSISESVFQTSFKDLQKCWQQCFNAEGVYFEDD
jgi:hypothetical protein